VQIDHKTPLAFIDLETTGTSPRHHRIIEVGIVRVEEGRIVREYRTLVNPGELVPAFVTSLTGISSAMLVDAPTFDELALEIHELLNGALFIAHNAPFDYGFLTAEFRRIGMAFVSPYLCTAKLSRALFPEHKRHNLDSIIERFKLDPGSRHRALDDARVLHQFLAVARSSYGDELLHEIMQEQLRVRNLPVHITEEMIHKLPEEPGVYYFHGKDNELLYVGKSRKVRTRVRSHFSKDALSSRGRDMLSEIRRITYEQTAGEVGALLLESQRIKRDAPTYNIRGRKRHALCLAHEAVNEDGYHTITLSIADTVPPGEEKNIAGLFTSKKQAKGALHTLAKEHELCPHLLGIEKKSPCFSSELEQCRGACKGTEKPRHYNRRFRDAFDTLRLKDWPFKGPIGIEEKRVDGTGELFIVDKWRLLAALTFDGTEWSEFVPTHFTFEYDVYKILARELTRKRPKIVIRTLTMQEESLFLGNI
jgi:DNA polymerase-3 subunit epsilon